MGSVIGSGIFLVPGPILRDVGGSVRLSIFVWIAGGVLSLLGALTYGELTAMNPAAGGLYVYVRDAFGELPGFLYGWTLFLVIATGTNATLAVAFSNYLNQIVPLTPIEGHLVAVAMLAVATVVNVLGTRRSTDLNNWATWTKLMAIAAMSAALLILGRGLGHGGARGAEMLTAPAGGSMFAGFGVAMIAVLWAYEGWQWVTYTASETIDPQRNFPRAFLIGTLLLIVLYVVADVAYLVALGPAEAARSDTIAATAIAAVLGPNAAKLVALMILISVFSTTNSGVLMAPRVFYAMARDGLFFGSWRPCIRSITLPLSRSSHREFGRRFWRGAARSNSSLHTWCLRAGHFTGWLQRAFLCFAAAHTAPRGLIACPGIRGRRWRLCSRPPR